MKRYLGTKFYTAIITLPAIAALIWSANGQAERVVGFTESSPRLIVVIVVDQMRADYIERYARDWKGGIRRLLSEGASFTRAEYQYFSSATCSGHATIATGLSPSTHGLIGNVWFDRVSGRKISCSIKTIRALTLADALQKHSAGDSIILSLSQKERVSSVMGGQDPSATVFLGSSRWKVSAARSDEWRDQIHEVLEAHPIESDRETVWTPVDSTARSPANGDFLRPLHIANDGRRKFYRRWTYSPYSDTSLKDLAVAILKRSDLGQSDRTDYLAIGFSALDRVGHKLGPNSAEVRDVLLRLDKSLGSLFSALDEKVGRGRYIIAFTSDHGVAPTVADQSARGIDSGRVTRGEVVGVLNATLQKLYGPGEYVSRVLRSHVYLAPGVFQNLGAGSMARREVESALTSIQGIAEVVWADVVLNMTTQAMTPMQRRFSREYVPDRSGDLLLVPKPYWTVGSDNAADHNTGHEYDVKVPMILMGAGIAAGRYDDVVSPIDIAPTLAYLAGIPFEPAEGRLLLQVLLNDSKKSLF
jgi:predicted AlkP superfamily pyrophosphatase or phosphodiesterase